MMIPVYFDKLYKNDRKQECCSLAVPFAKGELYREEAAVMLQHGREVPSQTKVTSRYADGSIRYLFTRFMADLPGNAGTTLEFLPDRNAEKAVSQGNSEFTPLQLNRTDDGYQVDTGCLSFQVKDRTPFVFRQVKAFERIYQQNQFTGPLLKDGTGREYGVEIGEWKVAEQGPVCVILSARGRHLLPGEQPGEHSKGLEQPEFTIRIQATAGKPWLEMEYRLFNTTSEPLQLQQLCFALNRDGSRQTDLTLHETEHAQQTDSTGCGDLPLSDAMAGTDLYHTRGTGQLSAVCDQIPLQSVRTMAAISNYKTDFYIGKNGREVSKKADAKLLLKEANEHMGEVFYGTMMTDFTDEEGGVCATIFQAQQNYPKAVRADGNGLVLYLVPEDTGRVVMQPGMAKSMQFMLHFHDAAESMEELDNRSLIYQMPDRPFLNPAVFRNAGVFPDIFPEKPEDDVEITLVAKADGHARCYGMLNWGDSWDAGYTRQGRGNGRLVWSNNEYDYSHACAMQYARTGVRRFQDYLFVSTRHWMDVDVCHYSRNPLHLGGQWEHTAGHCENGEMFCSHEWVEGMLDYYHFSGDERALETAVGIGENVLRLLDTPMYAVAGESNARETGWALRSLTAMYVETGEERWVAKCKWIIRNFQTWEEQYGHWLAPYTDNTAIRVGFMISVAVGSVMRYYRVFPDEQIRQMLLRQIDDLIENGMLNNGLFYYKELPSLQRLGTNTLLLESLAIGYELTGDKKYLLPGKKTFLRKIRATKEGGMKEKKEIEDAVVCSDESTKDFAQSFLPLITYFCALEKADMADSFFD